MSFGLPVTRDENQLTYSGYLKVRELTSLQQLLSDPPQHDETLFIIIHQTYELWFKQLLHELDAIIGRLDADQPLAHMADSRCVETSGVASSRRPRDDADGLPRVRDIYAASGFHHLIPRARMVGVEGAGIPDGTRARFCGLREDEGAARAAISRRRVLCVA